MFQMHECSQVIHSIVVVLLRQMPNLISLLIVSYHFSSTLCLFHCILLICNKHYHPDFTTLTK